MALIKRLELESGVSGEYWKIIKANIDFLERRAEITFGLLKDKSLNDAKYDKVNNSELILKIKRVEFGPDNFPFTKDAIEGENIKAIAYTASKEADEYFLDATDDLDQNPK